MVWLRVKRILVILIIFRRFSCTKQWSKKRPTSSNALCYIWWQCGILIIVLFLFLYYSPWREIVKDKYSYWKHNSLHNAWLAKNQLITRNYTFFFRKKNQNPFFWLRKSPEKSVKARRNLNFQILILAIITRNYI